MRKFFALFALIAGVLGVLTTASAAFSQVLPSTEWKTHRSGHYEIIYDASGQALAQHYIERLPTIEKRLSQVWHHWPEKIAIVISDQTDLTNGFATSIPYPMIYVFPVLPSPLDTIGEYNDWALEIVLHESTHILTFEERRDVVSDLHTVFGSIVTPNEFLPRWWLEGIAVDGETRFSSGGRLRSSFQSAMTRAFVAENRLDDFQYPEINEFEILNWPYGSRPYYFGSYIWSQLIYEHGQKLIYDLHHRTGGRAPFLITEPLRDLTKGHDAPEWFDRTTDALEVDAKAQLKTLGQKPLSEDKDFPTQLKEIMSPSVSADGLHLAVIGKDEAYVRAVAIYQRSNVNVPFQFQFLKRFPQNIFTHPVGPIFPRGVAESEGADRDDGPPGGAISRVSWSPDSKYVIFDFVEQRNQFQQVSDLWRLDVERRKTHRFTKDLRAREPGVSPDGQQVAYVQLAPLQTSLALWDFRTESSKILWTAPIQDRISWPTWLNENDIVFVFRSSESEKLRVFHRDSNKVEDILLSYRNVGFPEFAADNRLFFQARENGVGNVYVASADLKSAQPLTHVGSMIVNFSIDPRGHEIYATKLTSWGMQLKTITTPKTAIGTLPTVPTIFADRYPADPPPAAESLARPDLSKDENYSPFNSYLLPHYWFPFVSWNDEGVDISLTTGGQDPLSKNSYQIGGTYYGELGDYAYAGVFSNQSFWPRFSIFDQKLISYLVTTSDKTTNEELLGTVAVETPSIHPGVEFVGGYADDKYTKFGYTDSTSGPLVGVQYNHGTSLFVKRATSNSAGGDPYDSYLVNIPLYFPMPWSLVQALRIRFQGQYIDHDVPAVEMSQSTASSSAIAVTPTSKDYLLRGYIYGKFLAKDYMVANVDYTFPIRDVNWGFDHFAAFFKRLSAAVVTDYSYQDGEVVNENLAGQPYQSVDMNKLFWDYGVELSLTTTLGYSVPAKFILGYYMPVDTSVTASSPQVVLSFGL